jgi:hemoglobin
VTDSETSTTSADGNGASGGSPAPSHYERIGGAASVKTAVELFYKRVLDDPDLAPYFVSTDMEQQRRHMVLMLTTVLGGPNNYAGRGLAEAHQPLNIPVEHYAKVGGHLIATLTELNVPADILGDVQAVLAQVRDQVVSDGNRVGA